MPHDSTLLPNRARDDAERDARRIIYALVDHCERHNIGVPSCAARYANDLRLAKLAGVSEAVP